MLRGAALAVCLLATAAGPSAEAGSPGDRNHTNKQTTGTQTWHQGETVRPGQRGSDGRTTDLTRKQIPPGLPGAGSGGCPVAPSLNFDQMLNTVLNCLMQPAVAEPLTGGTKDKWDEWNNGVADAIANEFESHLIGFQDTYGAEKIPLEVTIDYRVIGPPAIGGWTYAKKTYPYGIEILGKPVAAAIPASPYYGLDAKGIATVRQNYINIAMQSIYAAATSYQSRLKFPCEWKAGPPPPGTYTKSFTFRNTGATGLTFEDTTKYRPC